VIPSNYIVINDDSSYTFTINVVDCSWNIIYPSTYNKDFYCPSDLYCSIKLGGFTIQPIGNCNNIYI
jgi:hypothetical protein